MAQCQKCLLEIHPRHAHNPGPCARRAALLTTCAVCGRVAGFWNAKARDAFLVTHPESVDCLRRRAAQRAKALGLMRAGDRWRLLRDVGLAERRDFGDDLGAVYAAPTWAVQYANRYYPGLARQRTDGDFEVDPSRPGRRVFVTRVIDTLAAYNAALADFRSILDDPERDKRIDAVLAFMALEKGA